MGDRQHSIPHKRYLPWLCVLFLLFVFRVTAQLLQKFNSTPYLPPFERWYSGALSYGWLLLSQFIIIILMALVIGGLAKRRIIPSRNLGVLFLFFGTIYFAAMAFRLIAALAVYARDISCLASANPSTLIRLSVVINADLDTFIKFTEEGDATALGIKLPQGLQHKVEIQCEGDAKRAAELERLKRQRNKLTFSDLWPNLKAIVTWTSGNCGLLIAKLSREITSSVQIIDMGYLSSEFWGTITIDAKKNLALPTMQHNFFEFIEPNAWDAGDRKTFFLSELQEGTQYYIIVTTSDGLYRYFMNDIVQVTGRYENTPTLVFVQKGKGVTSITGEKLYEAQVIQAVQEVSLQHKIEADTFIMLADRQSFAYTLYIECENKLDPAQFSTALNESLCQLNVEYLAKYKSGRIGAVRVRQLRSGTFYEYMNDAIKAGQRAGQYKTIKLQYLDEISFPFHNYVSA